MKFIKKAVCLLAVIAVCAIIVCAITGIVIFTLKKKKKNGG